jgi:CheY-like chemotaxis protein
MLGRSTPVKSSSTESAFIINQEKIMVTAVRELNILLVEDDEVDVMNVRRAFKKNNITSPLYRAANGIEALTMLRCHKELTTDPQRRLLILLDLNMPKMGGLEFLKELRADPNLHHLPVVILSTSNQDEDLISAYQYNVAGYMIKPINFSQFVEKIEILNRYWLSSEMPQSRY